MNIKRIGNYTIMQEPNKWKQIYSPHKRMMQISGNRVWYIDTSKMCTIKEFVRKLIRVK